MSLHTIEINKDAPIKIDGTPVLMCIDPDPVFETIHPGRLYMLHCVIPFKRADIITDECPTWMEHDVFDHLKSQDWDGIEKQNAILDKLSEALQKTQSIERRSSAKIAKAKKRLAAVREAGRQESIIFAESELAAARETSLVPETNAIEMIILDVMKMLEDKA